MIQRARRSDPVTWLLLALGTFLVLVGAVLAVVGRVPLSVRANILYHREPIGAIAGDLTVGQTVMAPYSGLYRIGVSLADYARANTGMVNFRLMALPGREVVAESQFDAALIRGDMYQWFEFAPLAGSAGRAYYFELSAPEATLDNCITAYIQPSDPYPDGEAYHGGQPVPGDLEFVLHFRPSAWQRARILLGQIVAGRPGPWGSPIFVVALALAYAGMAGALVWSLRKV